MFDFNDLLTDEFSVEAMNKNRIEAFKKEVVEHAKHVATSWENGINEYIIEYADLLTAKDYAKYYGADYEELKAFVKTTYNEIAGSNN